MTKQSTKIDFSVFSFSDVIVNAINKAGYKVPTDVQFEAIPAVLAGKDVLARAETGSGKTAAFVLPLLENLSNQNIDTQTDTHQRFDGLERARSNQVQILVLVPTRELAIQVCQVFEQLAENIKPRLKCLSVYGGVKINPQMMDMRGGVDILVATPGRLLDLVAQKAVKFNQIKTLVVDEVDRLMKGDFQEEITRIIKLLPNKRQNLMFTATFPESIRPLIREVLHQPEIINIDDLFEAEMIEHRVITVNHNKKNDLLAHLLNEHQWQQVLIFCSAKRTCDNLQIKLEKRDIAAVVMHGNKEQSVRSAALTGFKSGATRILIATDVAARGIDIEHLPCVINFDLPRSPNDYMHRVGRTGRAGQTGQAISLIAHHEYQHFVVIEKHNSLRLTREQMIGFEADEIAPPMPGRSKPKKKSKNKRKTAKQKVKPEQKMSEPVSALTNATVDKNQAEAPKQQETTEDQKRAVNAHIWGKL